MIKKGKSIVKSFQKKHAKFPIGITLVAIFAIIAGLGEIVVGFTGNYLGILTKSIAPSPFTALVGSFYSLGGTSILTKKRWGAVLGIGFISAEVLGRIYLVIIGIAPSHGFDAFKILVGATIAIILIIYILLNWKHFK